MLSARWRHNYVLFLCAQVTPLVHRFFGAIFYFHEAWIKATTISIQSRYLLHDIRHFYSDFTVYATPYLAHGTHIRGITELRQCHGTGAWLSLRTIIH